MIPCPNPACKAGHHFPDSGPLRLCTEIANRKNARAAGAIGQGSTIPIPKPTREVVYVRSGQTGGTYVTRNTTTGDLSKTTSGPLLPGDRPHRWDASFDLAADTRDLDTELVELPSRYVPTEGDVVTLGDGRTVTVADSRVDTRNRFLVTDERGEYDYACEYEVLLDSDSPEVRTAKLSTDAYDDLVATHTADTDLAVARWERFRDEAIRPQPEDVEYVESVIGAGISAAARRADRQNA